MSLEAVHALALAATDTIPAARAVVMENAWHMAHSDQPDA
jgi:hypothetical protein